MAFGDGTGPAGMGPMTGRAAGFCAGFSSPGYANPVGGRGYFGRGRGGFGQGGGQGRRNWFNATGIPGWARAAGGFFGQTTEPTITAEFELENLKQQAELLQNSLSQINERIKKFEKAETE